MNNSNCNLCEDYTHYVIYEDSQNYEYSICKNCGHVYQSLRKSTDHYYNLPYESQWKDYENHSKNRANYIADFCTPHINKAEKLVDIGCGPGGIMKFIKERFPKLKVHGITSEIDKEIMIGDFDVTYCNFETDKVSYQTSYDFIVMSHVLEHFINPKIALKKVREIMTNSGYLYIEVPSFTWGGVRSNTEFCPVHLSYFTIDRLKQLLITSGFEIVKSQESKYWGNIKIVAKKSFHTEKNKYKINWKSVIFTWKINRIFGHRLYRFLSKLVNVNPND